MTTKYSDNIEFRGTVSIRPVTIPFSTAQIKSGTVAGDLPAGATVIGVSITMAQGITFTNDTTGVTIKAGTAADDDGYFAATQANGAAGNKPIAAAGALVGTRPAGGIDSVLLVFAATGGSALLSDVTAGAGQVELLCIMPIA